MANTFSRLILVPIVSKVLNVSGSVTLIKQNLNRVLVVIILSEIGHDIDLPDIDFGFKL